MRIAVAATASFGADLLERLAALPQLELAFLLTRPDAPKGRGRRLAPPPAKEAAERLGIPVIQPDRPELPPDAVDAVVVCAYGLLIPDDLLARSLWLNVHPSLLPRWRGAAPVERAILAGDETTGVTIHETVKALDAGPIAAQEAFPIGAGDDAGDVFERSAALAASLIASVLPTPRFTPQPEEGVTYAEKITPSDRELDLADPRRRVASRARPLAPYRRLGRDPWTPGDGLARRAGKRDTGPARSATRGAAANELRGVPARRAGVTAPARAAAFRVVRRVFEDGAYADRAMASAVDGLDTRDRALAQRIAYGTVQRMRTIDHGIDILGSRPAAELDPPVLAALRIAGYEAAWSDTPAHATVNDVVELVRGAGLAHATGFTNAVARRLVEGFPALVAALPPGPLAESYPDWIYHTWVRDFGEDQALDLMRAQNEPAELVVRSAVAGGRADRHSRRLPARARADRGATTRPGSGRAAGRNSLRSRSARATARGSSMPAPRRERRPRC